MASVELSLQFVAKELVEEAQSWRAQALTHLQMLADGRCAGGEWTGWYDYPQKNGRDLTKQITSFSKSLGFSYDLVIVVGIGGSYLGTRALAEALSGKEDFGQGPYKKIVYAGHHLAASELADLLSALDHHEPLINVISKSGTTTEPAVAFRLLRQYMEKRFGKEEASRRIIATTDESKGALRQLAEKEGYETFVVPDDIGGRYSVLSAVGMVPLTLAGYDAVAIQEGAHSVFQELSQTLQSKTPHPALDYACLRHAAHETGAAVEVLAMAEPRLTSFGEWWKQLFGESEGKGGKGLFPASVVYTTDLHSLGQYLQDGKRHFVETFLSFQSSPDDALIVQYVEDDLDQLNYLAGKPIDEVNEQAVLATKLAHHGGGVPCAAIECGPLGEQTMGALVAFFEVSCAVSGLLLGVNPFDQPGVEAYKENMFALLGKKGFEPQREKLLAQIQK